MEMNTFAGVAAFDREAAGRMDKNTVTKELVLSNTHGLHVRPASLFVQTAMRYTSKVRVENVETAHTSDGKSVMGMLMLSAPKGARLRIAVTGADCEKAMDALEDLVNRGFDED